VNIPILSFVKSEAERVEDACCDLCCAVPVVGEVLGDMMCADCADKWTDDEPEFDEDELRHALRNAGVYRGAMIEARLTDAELLGLSRIQNRHVRDGRGSW
jgi:hypothetical protein